MVADDPADLAAALFPDQGGDQGGRWVLSGDDLSWVPDD